MFHQQDINELWKWINDYQRLYIQNLCPDPEFNNYLKTIKDWKSTMDEIFLIRTNWNGNWDCGYVIGKIGKYFVSVNMENNADDPGTDLTVIYTKTLRGAVLFTCNIMGDHWAKDRFQELKLGVLTLEEASVNRLPIFCGRRFVIGDCIIKSEFSSNFSDKNVRLFLETSE